MQTVEVTFSSDDIRCFVALPNGEQKEFWLVSAMLNWCYENNYSPVLAGSEVAL